jgi:serine/threonine protein kinase
VYLHAAELIHRDLSSNNILLDAPTTTRIDCRCKIADFGLSISKSEGQTQSAGVSAFARARVCVTDLCCSRKHNVRAHFDVDRVCVCV